MRIFIYCLIYYNLFLTPDIKCQSYEDKRCKCVCPKTTSFANGTGVKDRSLYVGNVPSTKCNCDEVVLPHLTGILINIQDYCVQCDCKYEERKTAVIKMGVVIVISIIFILLMYMGFLAFLNYLTMKATRRRKFVPHSSYIDEAQNILLQEIDEDD